jgi:hypothetical protein
MGALEAVLLGCAGGLLTEIYGVYNLRKQASSQRPSWLKSPFYWIMTTIMVALGGGTVWLYLHSGATVSPVLALHLGAATPTLIATLSKSSPTLDTAA